MHARSPISAVVVTMAAALLLSSCSGAGEVEDDGPADLDVSTGVTDDSVVIGTHMPLTGPAAPGYSQIPAGAGAVFDYINENGGIHGREIDYRVEDDVYHPTTLSRSPRTSCTTTRSSRCSAAWAPRRTPRSSTS